MYKGPIKNYLNKSGFMLCPADFFKVFNLAGLSWGMPSAQYCAMQMWGLQNVTVLKTEVKKEDAIIFRHEQPIMSMLGLPVELDNTLPSSTVQLRYQGAVLYEIQNLALPTGFED